ncbi:hypothetical protein UFOVP270_56, partial [uncultured Caudovirales phage]
MTVLCWICGIGFLLVWFTVGSVNEKLERIEDTLESIYSK